MSDDKKKWIAIGVAVILVAAMSSTAGYYLAPRTAPPVEQVREQFRENADDSKRQIERVVEHRTVVIEKDGEIRAKKEAEIHALSGDALVDRWIKAVERYHAETADGPEGMGRSADRLRGE